MSVQLPDNLSEKKKKTLLEKLLLAENDTLSRTDMIRRDSCALKSGESCGKCDGQGYIPVSRGVYAGADLCECVVSCRVCFGKSLDVSSGEAKMCRRPSPFKRAGLFNRSCIPARYARVKFDHFNNRSGNCMEMCGKVRSWVAQYRAGNEAAQKGFILSGPVGCGKTYLLTTAVKVLAHSGVSVRFIDFFQLIAEIKASYSAKKEISEGLLKSLLDVDVLAIDELGKGRRTDFEQTILDQLVMGRYNQEKVIIASTNCSLNLGEEKEEKYYGESEKFMKIPPLNIAVGPRIYSRLSETAEFWGIHGDDYRLRRGP